MLIRRKLISERAEHLRDQTGQMKFPVDPLVVAEHLGIQVECVSAPSDDISGFLLVETDRVLIGLNCEHSTTRKRFTLSHEIGHFVLQHHLGQGTPHVDKQMKVHFRNSESSTGEKMEEVEANLFAAELLMPSSLLKQSLQKYSSLCLGNEDDSTIRLLANECDVSAVAMTIRLSSLSLLKL